MAKPTWSKADRAEFERMALARDDEGRYIYSVPDDFVKHFAIARQTVYSWWKTFGLPPRRGAQEREQHQAELDALKAELAEVKRERDAARQDRDAARDLLREAMKRLQDAGNDMEMLDGT